MKVVILGAGVIGLSVAIRAIEEGHNVEIFAEKITPYTNSDRAGAYWSPFTNTTTSARIVKWGKESYRTFCKLIKVKNAGVSLVDGLEYFNSEDQFSESWCSYARNFRKIPRNELPKSFVAGFSYLVPVILMEKYMRWLMKRFGSLGGKVTKKRVCDLSEIDSLSDIIVNCTGLGSIELFGDKLVTPIRGQTVKVRVRSIDLSTSKLYADPEFYIVPQSDGILLGATAQKGDWNTNVNLKDTQYLIKKGGSIAPRIGNAPSIVNESVGLRPYRPQIRLEIEKRSKGEPPVVHNYGHGFNGVTFSWGCAKEVVEIIKNYFRFLDLK